MNEYVKQAKDFLESCNATIKITQIGCEQNKNWNDNGWHNTYRERGIEPNEYDIITCLEKYDVGTIDDFVWEFGYEVNEWADVKRIQNIYNAVKRQYKSLCRCFTEEQIEAMQEIQ